MKHHYKITIGSRVKRFTSKREALKYINQNNEPCAQLATIDRNALYHKGLITATELKKKLKKKGTR